MISVILPTYNEVENIRLIVPELSRVFEKEKMDGEIIVVDDNSPDGTACVAEELAKSYPVRVHVRKSARGLSKAVMEGFALSQGDICVVMDADLSHPVEKLPEMVRPIMQGDCDAVIGSRYVEGGGSENWSLVRRMMSRGAGFLAKGVTRLSDPTSGFMAVRKDILAGRNIDPLGWKIVLEVVVKVAPRFIEVPILFADRAQGKSKLSLGAQVDYLHHLWRLYCYRYRGVFEFIKFSLVGFSGLIVDTLVLVGFVDLLLWDPRSAAVIAFSVAVTWNYLFDRSWAFQDGRSTKITYSYISFVTICLVGLSMRILVMHLLIEYAGMGARPWYILASFFGILGATLFNFFGSKYLSFGRYFKRP